MIEQKPISPGTIIGDKYEIVSVIGSGGMGTVYRVHQNQLGKEFALKFLDVQKSSEISVRRFQQEARTASQLQHPNLVEVHDFGSFDDEHPYLVMDLVEGETLSELLKKKGALPVDFVIAMTIQVCFGLMYAHEKGVVHRDIKPSNIMLLYPDRALTEGTAKILDFGIAKLTQSEDGEIQALTKTGEIFGSPLYMSPEQCRGVAVDKRSDIYSLGCVIYECLTGSPPIFGDSAMATMMKKLSDAPVSLKEGSLGRDFPAALEGIVRKALAIAPEERYQDLTGLTKDLMALQRNDSFVQVTAGSTAAVIPASISNARMVPYLMALIFVSSAITHLVDRYCFFQNTAAYIAADKLPLDVQRLSYREESPFSLLAKTTIDKNFNSEYPSFKRETGSGKDATITLLFPADVGKIVIDDRPISKALGKFVCRPDSKIHLFFNKFVGAQPHILKNLVGINLVEVSFNYDMMTNESTLDDLAKFPGIKAVSLKGTGTASLKPLTALKNLDSLDIMDTGVSDSELANFPSLPNLHVIWFGPVASPKIVFAKLAKSNKCNFIGYLGHGTGVSKADCAALVPAPNLWTLYFEKCPKLGDAEVVELQSVKKLSHLSLMHVSVTPRSIQTFRKFKALKTLNIIATGWSLAQIRELKNSFEEVTFESRGMEKIDTDLTPEEKADASKRWFRH